MRFDLISLNWPPYLETRLSVAGWLVLSAYALAVLWELIRSYRDFAGLSLKRVAVFALLLAAAPLLAETLVVRLDGPPPLALPGQPRTPTDIGLPLLGAIAMLVAATWLGTGPAVVIGLATGLAWAALDTFRLSQAFEVALWGVAMGAMLNQRYKGPTGTWLRQPIVAATLSAGGVGWPAALIGLAVAGPEEPLASLQYVTAVMWPTLLVYGGQGLLAGALAQAADAILGELRPRHGQALVTPPWARRLNRRILFAIAPPMILGIVVLFGAVMFSAHRVATALVVDQMARDAANVSNNVPFFVQVGRGLIRDLAKDERLLSDEASARQARLSEGLRAVPFFQQLIYFDATRAPAAAYPDANVLELGLTPEEQSRVLAALEGGIPAEMAVYRPEDEQRIYMSFVSPVEDPATGEPVGALLGRADLDDNPIIKPVVSVLHGVLVDSGEGFIIDEQNRIILYPAKPERQLQTFELSGATQVAAGEWPGQVFKQPEMDGTQQLVYLLPIAGHADWSVVVTVPNEVVLAQAVEISLPILVILVLLTAAALPTIGSAARRLTEPLETLSEAAGWIAAGRLDHQVSVEGEDEVGRLGVAFEGMRLHLKSRLSEQSKLLDVSRRVSSSLELYRALPPILGAALEVTGAVGARIALRAPDGAQIYAAGQGAAGMAPLDKQLLDLVEHEGPIVVGQLWKAAGSIDASRIPTPIKALLAVPLRSETSYHGVLWLGYTDEHDFEETELTFVSTLAGQAAVAVANARLFEAAEGGRQRLAAILQSTADAVLVTDRKGRLVLINPAAADLFGTQAELARGRAASEVVDLPELVKLLTDLQEPTTTLELPSRNDRTFYASVSTIVGGDRKVAGRVAVLRDITHLKELDAMKDLLLETVAHDIRSPLTFVHGFARLLSELGDLNELQAGNVAKIIKGIERISRLANNLLDISRLESVDMLQLGICRVQDIIQEECEGFAEHAKEKRIKLQVHAPDDLPPIMADPALYGRAIGNLIDNAIKYTPEGGRVEVKAYVEDEHMVVMVRDNGPGIAPQHLENLFTPYYRIRSPGGAKVKGTGLGLALTRLIAERHHGSVRVESEEGTGSTFYLSLPLRQPDED